MADQNIHKIMLEQYARRIYTISKHVNLNILCCKKDNPNIKKLKTDIQMIKGLVANIENEINN